MPKVLSDEQVRQYGDDGYVFPIDVMDRGEALAFRQALEAHEAAAGGPLHSNQRHKTHLLFTWANRIAHQPRILDAVEDILGPDVLLWTSTFFIKEAGSPNFVSWHQDATYWGLSGNDVVTAWVALSDAPVESGAMKFWPGSHKQPILPHHDSYAAENLLSRGQEIAVNVPEEEAVLVPLAAGQMSLHHVLLVHGSEPNRTDDRRIGFALRYIPTRLSQTKTEDFAMLVRGEDRYGHFTSEPEPVADLDAAALAAHERSVGSQLKALYSGTDKTEFRA